MLSLVEHEKSFINLTLCLVSIEMDQVISELFYNGAIIQRNYRKMTILWSFSYYSFVKFHSKKFGSHTTTVFYPNPCYNEVL